MTDRSINVAKASKQQLIRLFESRDVRRRRKLYEHFEDYFAQKHSAIFTIELINKDLGKEMINRRDIKYIRAHCHLWKTPEQVKPAAVEKFSAKKPTSPTWTNQEELKNPTLTGSKLDTL